MDSGVKKFYIVGVYKLNISYISL